MAVNTVNKMILVCLKLGDQNKLSSLIINTFDPSRKRVSGQCLYVFDTILDNIRKLPRFQNI